VLACWALWRKLRIEERWMRERFGAAYEEYSRQVSALIQVLSRYDRGDAPVLRVKNREK
jgi:protein-S-isoprenylcysteine O-methyltransferase Ste14